jgi:uncharacterized protein
MGTFLSEPISAALFGKTQRTLLAFLFTHPDERFYLRELARATGTGVGALQRELKRLTQVGILQRTAQGKEVYYQVNPGSPVFEDLKNLMLKTAGVAEVLTAALQPIAGRIRAAFVYGSMARGEPRKESDVDVLLVGDVTFAEVSSALQSAADRLRRETNPTVYSPAEFRKKLSAKDHFLQSVVKEPKIFLIGNDDELARLASERLDRKA